MDDEKKLTQIFQEVFTSYGYKINTFTDPLSAWAHFEKRPDAYDLVITDMAMPSLTGMELVKKILALRPELPTIFCTGFSEAINKEKAMEIGIRMYYQKPVMIANMVESVRMILDNEK